MLCGDGGECIFFQDEDRCRMCFLIQEGIEHYGHRLLGYCFMTNHIAKVRGILALMVRETEELTLEALGRYLERDANGLSRQAARLTSKSLSSQELFL